MMAKHVGVWPLISYTMISWSLMTARYTLQVLGITRVAELLRFPSLAQNSVTVLVWWLILVPIMHLNTSGKARADFWKWNLSPFLLNVHGALKYMLYDYNSKLHNYVILFVGANLPLAVVDHLISPRQLTHHDLWTGLAIGTAYLTFYLNVLDSNGLHLYIILSPRTVAAALVYAASLASYGGLWKFWSAAAQRVMKKM